MARIILHLDLDSFYASCEEVRNPSLRGKPVVVCMFSGRGEGGAVATANYPARALGIHSGLPIAVAKARASKEAVFLPADREYYKKVSDRIMEILREYADSFEQRSIDEAYLDVSRLRSLKKAQEISRKIKQEVLQKEGLTCSVGIGPNKLIAKMACREKKPNGLTVVREQEVGSFLFGKPVEKLFGVGPKTLEALEKYKIKTIKDLAALDKGILIKEFGGKKGLLLHSHAQGRDEEPVAELVKQQASRIGTLPEDTQDHKKIQEKLSSLADDLSRKVKKEKITFRAISIILITTSQEMMTRSITLQFPSTKKEDILEQAEALLKEFLKSNPKATIRRVGVRVSSFGSPPEKTKKQKSLKEF